MKQKTYELFTEAQLKEISAAFTSEKTQTLLSQMKENVNKDELGSFDIIISTDGVDRQGEIVKQEGLDYSNYMNNPVVLFGHDYKSMPVAVTSEIIKEEGRTRAKGFFAPTEDGQNIRKLYDFGFLRTASIGFIPKEHDAKDASIITKGEVLEWSFVPVPANPMAISMLEANAFAVKELATKGIILTATEETEVKGAVMDELTAEEAMEKKCDLMEDFWEVVYAFCDVFYDENTTPDQFGTLLGETAALLQRVANGEDLTGDDAAEGEGKMLTKEKLKAATKEKFLELMGTKAGRMISDANMQKMQSAVESIQGGCDIINEMMSSAVAASEGKAAPVEVDNAKEKNEYDLVKILQVINTTTNQAIKEFKARK